MKALLVWNARAKEGVVFTDPVDARYASTGRTSGIMGVSSVADAWRDTYADEDEDIIFPIIDIEIPDAE